MKIRAYAEVVYDTEDVIREYLNDYPSDSFTESDAKDMIMSWIKDDFTLNGIQVTVEEIKDGSQG